MSSELIESNYGTNTVINTYTQIAGYNYVIRYNTTFLTWGGFDGVNAGGRDFRYAMAPVTLSAANRVYVTGDRDAYYRRSNGGASMSDTLPTPAQIASTSSGFLLGVANVDASATLTLTAAAGLVDGAASIALEAGRAIILICDGANFYTTQSGLSTIRQSNPVVGGARATLTTAGNGTVTASLLMKGLIARSGPSAAFTDTFDTAANIVAAYPNAVAGSFFEATIENATGYAATMAAGTGVTLSGNTSVYPGGTRRFICFIASVTAPAVTIDGGADGYGYQPASAPAQVAASGGGAAFSTGTGNADVFWTGLGGTTRSLPAAGTAGREIAVYDSSGAASISNQGTLTVSGGGTINGASSFVFTNPYQSAVFKDTGSAWLVKSST